MTEKDMIIQDLRRENKELRASAPKWISVEDRLPEQGEEAICIAADGDMMIGKYTELPAIGFVRSSGEYRCRLAAMWGCWGISIGLGKPLR